MDGGKWTFSEGGGYELGGSIGQPGARGLIGGDYILGGGFWSSMVEHFYRVILPLIFKNYGP